MVRPPLQKPALCLHVGYGKTGSTAIQSWLLSQRNELKAAGVAYPVFENSLGDSGNGSLLMEALAHSTGEPWWLEEMKPGFQAMLFSREQFARELSQPGWFEQLVVCAKRWGFGSIKILLFIRDPRDHCYSLWAQKVKRAGERRSLAQFAADYDAISMVTSFVQNAFGFGFDIRVLDYGRCRTSLILSFNRWLSYAIYGVNDYPFDLGLKMSSEVFVNVTPSRSQLRLQRHLHGIWPGGKAPIPPRLIAKILMWPSFDQRYLNFEIIEKWKLQVAAFNQVCGQRFKFFDNMPFESEN